MHGRGEGAGRAVNPSRKEHRPSFGKRGIMKTQQLCIKCPSCSSCIILPRPSHLWVSDDQLNPSKHVWPINFWCLPCGKLSQIPTEAIQRIDAEAQSQYQLVRYDFTSDQSGLVRNVGIYTQERESGRLPHPSEQIHESEAIERILKPSGLWDISFGDCIHVSRDAGIKSQIPSAARK